MELYYLSGATEAVDFPQPVGSCAHYFETNSCAAAVNRAARNSLTCCQLHRNSGLAVSWPGVLQSLPQTFIKAELWSPAGLQCFGHVDFLGSSDAVDRFGTTPRPAKARRIPRKGRRRVHREEWRRGGTFENRAAMSSACFKKS